MAAGAQANEIGAAMSGNFYSQKKRLLTEMRTETLEQLRAVRAEDVEAFLDHVERCNQIIESINQLDAQNEARDPSEEQELRRLLQEVIEVRQHITPLLVPLRDKLRQGAVMERRQVIIQKGYNKEEAYLPSIFFDRKE
ncbi:flagellar protein FliT [Aneurinibacillus thermoaerophilus]|nr:flagellar protein FliT [Aneurinibacillus thermoaerophilus]